MFSVRKHTSQQAHFTQKQGPFIIFDLVLSCRTWHVFCALLPSCGQSFLISVKRKSIRISLFPLLCCSYGVSWGWIDWFGLKATSCYTWSDLSFSVNRLFASLTDPKNTLLFTDWFTVFVYSTVKCSYIRVSWLDSWNVTPTLESLELFYSRWVSSFSFYIQCFLRLLVLFVMLISFLFFSYFKFHFSSSF